MGRVPELWFLGWTKKGTLHSCQEEAGSAFKAPRTKPGLPVTVTQWLVTPQALPEATHPPLSPTSAHLGPEDRCGYKPNLIGFQILPRWHL